LAKIFCQYCTNLHGQTTGIQGGSKPVLSRVAPDPLQALWLVLDCLMLTTKVTISLFQNTLTTISSKTLCSVVVRVYTKAKMRFRQDYRTGNISYFVWISCKCLFNTSDTYLRILSKTYFHYNLVTRLCWSSECPLN
jgi:hypothetical protein